ncbi:transcriptional repressor p66-alpha-like [Conger conger]|uniref:transcriptional repressor p66-alpha-like n=1 Tax=Conger conger TaxID=82655 RepID=UPI002A5AF57A|nr:transcriptional repressor p66-alpha-like [Conger conger]
MNGLNHCPKEMDTERLLRSSPEERGRVIKQLREELRLEEARLVLLKKLRQSQVHKEPPAPKTTGSSSSAATPPPLVRGSIAANKGSLQVVSGRSLGGVIPPPLVRGGQQTSSKPGSHNSHTVMPPLVRGAQPVQVTPQQIHCMRQQPHQHSSSGPPPLLLAPRPAGPGVQVQGQRVIQPGLIRVANVGSTGLLVNISQASANSLKGSIVTSQSQLTGGSVSSVSASESPASRQAAAKLALRKQLEKTLLEIPPPKPPAPQFNFLPSAANNEFIYLVGLEEVVQNLLDTLAKGKPQAPGAPRAPYTCAQCETDFTARWRPERSGASVTCEQCTSSGHKRALKAEHTGRLKAAFVKALQQEQDMERLLLQASAPPSGSSGSSSVVVKTEHARSSPASLQAHGRATPAARHHHSAIKQSGAQFSRSIQPTVVRGVTHAFSQTPQLQSAVAAAALVTRPGVTMAYVNPSLSAHKSSSAVERQREYLLDMIPSRSISQAANAWK